MENTWPVSITSPELQMSRCTNQSSVFEKIHGSSSRKATIQEIFSLTEPKLHQKGEQYMLKNGKSMQDKAV